MDIEPLYGVPVFALVLIALKARSIVRLIRRLF